MMHPVLFTAFQNTASHLAGRPIELQLRQPYYKPARGACFVDTLSGQVIIQVRPSLWDTDREAFLSVFLHETAHAKFHAPSLQPCDGNALPPVRSSNLRDFVLGMKDITDEIKADIQKIDWLLVAGKGPILEKLFRLLEIGRM